jgi:hypothetical protein
MIFGKDRGYIAEPWASAAHLDFLNHLLPLMLIISPDCISAIIDNSIALAMCPRRI